VSEKKSKPKELSLEKRVAIIVRKCVQYIHDPAVHKRPVKDYELTDSVIEKIGPSVTRMLRHGIKPDSREIAMLCESYVMSWSHSDPLQIKGEKKSYGYGNYNSSGDWNKWSGRSKLLEAVEDNGDNPLVSSDDEIADEEAALDELDEDLNVHLSLLGPPKVARENADLTAPENSDVTFVHRDAASRRERSDHGSTLLPPA
jgi:hypothetical protein